MSKHPAVRSSGCSSTKYTDVCLYECVTQERASTAGQKLCFVSVTLHPRSGLHSLDATSVVHLSN